MKGLNVKDLQGNDSSELRNTLKKLQEDLFQHRLKRNTNQLENTALIRNTRRDIARVNTVLTARLSAEKASGTAGAAAAKENAK